MKRILVFGALVSSLAGLAAAQTSTSQVTGTVRDEYGAVVPAAGATITNEATGVDTP